MRKNPLYVAGVATFGLAVLVSQLSGGWRQSSAQEYAQNIMKHMTAQLASNVPQFTGIKTVDVQSITPTGLATYTVTFTNNSGVKQDAMRIADIRPTGMVFVSNGSTPGCDSIGDLIMCPEQSVPAGGKISATLKMQLFPGAACGGDAKVDNFAALIQSTFADPTTIAYTNHVQIPVLCQNTGITSADVQNITTNGFVTYHISFTNNTATTQDNVRIVDLRPTGMIFVPAGSTDGCAQQGDNIFCPAQSVSPGGQISATIKMQLFAGAQCGGALQVDNRAIVQQNQNGFQSTIATTNHVYTPIICTNPQFTGTLLSDVDSITPTGFVTYTATFIYTTNQTANQAGISFLRPAGMIFVPDGSSPGCNQNGGWIDCSSDPVATSGNLISRTVKMQLCPGAACGGANEIDAKALVRSNLNGVSTIISYSNDVFTPVLCPLVSSSSYNSLSSQFSSMPFSSQSSSSSFSSQPSSSSVFTSSSSAPVIELRVVQEYWVAENTAVANQKDIAVDHFAVYANNQDLLFTGATFMAQSGSLLNARNYTLWVDSDDNVLADKVLQSGVASTNGLVTFNALQNGGYFIPKNHTVYFEVHADVADTIVNPPEILMTFATTTPGYVQARRVSNGTALNGIKSNYDDCTSAYCETSVLSVSASTLWHLPTPATSSSSSFSSQSSSSSVSTSSSSTPRTTELRVVQEYTGLEYTAVPNQKDLAVEHFAVRADNQDILFTGATFMAQSGSLLNGQNYTLWVDSDDNVVVDKVLQGGVSVVNGLVTFNALPNGGYLIPKNQTMYFEVHADIASSIVNPPALQMTFAQSTPGYVQAKRVSDGTTLNGIKSNYDDCAAAYCELNVNATSSSLLWHLVGHLGSLFVAPDVQPRSRQLLGGERGDEVLRLQFHAENEDVDVTNLEFNSSGSLATSVEALDLYKVGDSIPFASATVGNCGMDSVLTTNAGNGGVPITAFCATMLNRQLVIPQGQYQAVIIRPRIKSDEQGAVSGEPIQIWMTKQVVTNFSPAFGAVRARGVTSNIVLLPNSNDGKSDGEIFMGTSHVGPNTDIVGSLDRVVFAKIISIANGNSDVDGTNVPTGVSTFGQFTFTAASNNNALNGLNKVAFDSLIFNVDATNVALSASSFKLFNKNDESTKLPCVAKNQNGDVITGTVTGHFFVECTGLLLSTVSTQVNAGGYIRFGVEGQITANKVAVAPSSLQMSFQNFSNSAASAFSVTQSNVKWLDRDASFYNPTFYWLENGDSVVRSTMYKS